jgi:DNA-binding NtrC family response regulator
VDSHLGEGTTFTVFIPVAKGEVKEATEESAPLPRGTESLLLVDDEPIIVDIYSQMLGRLGYRVVARTDPLEALDTFRSDPNAYDLVVTDMTMPKLTGDQLATEVLKMRQDVPVILCTGFSEQMTEAKALRLGIKDFIMKPINKTEIARKIRKALDDHKAHGEKAET